MPKNIVVFSDGTGQDGGVGPNTNVYKLFNIIEDRTKEQIAFYDPGVGNQKYSIFGKAIGFGLSTNIKQCYRFIFENYEAGDKIYLFGFSRGAATVRSLSGLIELVGILPKSRPELIDEAYDIYREEDHNRKVAMARDFVGRHHTMWTKIEFLGCFDTVAALKGQSDYHNFNLSNSVIHARHAVSIDETRIPFEPVLWNKEIKPHQTMKQVYFLGVHTDVGGGYEKTGLADISYQWMLKEAKAAGLRIFDESRRAVNPNPNGFMHRELYMVKAVRLPYKNRPRSWNREVHGDLVVHSSVFERTITQENVEGRYHSWVMDAGCVTEEIAYGEPVKLKEA
ncbi:MAG: peptidoglycan-binding protein [Halobacteriovorax sp.]|nr:peptidoglycan-binding protein [Halobacteriovorax sp.]|tara:strand:+ start:12514 stop:13527 length:1014 start_codon:yes stop_codon:yes gene_type:complete